MQWTALGNRDLGYLNDLISAMIGSLGHLTDAIPDYMSLSLK